MKQPSVSSSAPLWRAQGSLSIVTDGQRQMLSFDWQQRGNDLFQILFSEFTYSVLLQNDHGKVTLTRPIDGMDPRVWDDLEQMQFWIRGLPAPHQSSSNKIIRQYDPLGRLIRLNQNGYLIQYQQYQSYFGHEVPTKMTVSTPTVQIRLVIDHWYFSTPKQHVAAADVMLLKKI